jgi:hypothetical protein
VALTIAAVVGGYAVVLFALFWRVWFAGQLSGWDCTVEYWPDLVFALHAIGDGEWPGWNPYAMGGYPYWADPQVGLYAPSTWVCWLLGAIGGDGPWLIQAKVLLNFLVGLCGMHAWVFARTRSHAAAAVAALVLVVGGPALVMKNSALLWPILHAPWVLWALERFVATPSARRAAVMAAATWLVATAGSPPGTFYVALVVIAYAAFLVLASPSPRHAHRVVGRAAAGVGGFAVLAALLVAATYLPAAAAMPESQRSERGPSWALSQPLEATALDEVVAPDLDRNWMHDLYMGAIGVAGGVWLVACARRRRVRAEAVFWIGIAVVGVLLALGQRGHLLPWLAEHVPGFGLFRIAYRYKHITGIAVAVLAGDAVAALVRGDAPRWARWAWTGAAVAWLAAAAAVGATAKAWLLAAATLAAATAAVHLTARVATRPGDGARRSPAWVGARGAVVALPLLVFLELWSAGAVKLAILQRRPRPDRDLAAAQVMAGTETEWRYHVGNPSSPYGGRVPYHVAFLAERRELSGYTHPMQPRRHIELTRRAKQSPELLRHFNVRYFAGHPRRPRDARQVGPGIVEVDDVAPLARWYGRTETLTAGQILDRMDAEPPSRTTAAYVEARDVAGVALPPPVEVGPVDGRLIRHRRGEVVVAIDAPAAGVLVVNEAFAPGWEAKVDGRPARIFRTAYHLRGVVVPAGASRVEMRYRPAGRAALPLAFVAGLLLTGAIALSPGRGRLAWLDRAPGEPR